MAESAEQDDAMNTANELSDEVVERLEGLDAHGIEIISVEEQEVSDEPYVEIERSLRIVANHKRKSGYGVERWSVNYNGDEWFHPGGSDSRVVFGRALDILNGAEQEVLA